MKTRTLIPMIGLALGAGFTLVTAAPDKAEKAETARPAKQAAAERNPGKDAKADKAEPAAEAKPAAEAPKEAAKEAPKPAPSPKHRAMAEEIERLSIENKLASERLNHATAKIRNEITSIKLQREAITERMALETTKRMEAIKDQLAKFEDEKQKASRERELASIRAEKLAAELKVAQQELAIRVSRLQNDIALLEAEERRAHFANAKPVYLDNPLREDGTLVISDRRIPLNGPIGNDTADAICSRIDFFNNKDPKLPIFIVIDDCPGGSVMAGYRILKKMEASDAPIHVVVRSFAASMAAVICTLAQESYAYPNSVILHHQISSSPRSSRLNLTQQREFFEESTRWWKRLATPVAEKMGLSTDAFIKRMYEHNTSGDWSEFGTEAHQLKWVNHIVTGIEESALVKSPDARPSPPAAPATPAPPQPQRGEELVDDQGIPYVWLPRLNPKDAYFLYNPDSYYRVR